MPLLPASLLGRAHLARTAVTRSPSSGATLRGTASSASKKPLDAAVRKGPEETAKKAVVAVDAPFVSTGSSLTAEGEARHAGRAVRVRFLLLLLASLPESARREVTTGKLVALLIKPATARWRCRFVELPGMSMHIGKPCAFVSHVWSALFADLVAAIAHAIPEDEYVWIDIL